MDYTDKSFLFLSIVDSDTQFESLWALLNRYVQVFTHTDDVSLVLGIANTLAQDSRLESLLLDCIEESSAEVVVIYIENPEEALLQINFHAYLSLSTDERQAHYQHQALLLQKQVMAYASEYNRAFLRPEIAFVVGEQERQDDIAEYLKELHRKSWKTVFLEYSDANVKQNVKWLRYKEHQPQFQEVFAHYREPQQADFDAYYYEVNGKSRKDWDGLPDFLIKEISEVHYGSGTNKFLWLIYQLAQKALLVLECGVFEGGTTVPLAKGLQCNGGEMYSIDIDLNLPLLWQRMKNYDLHNVQLLQGSDLEFNMPELKGLVDIIYIDTFHQYEETLKELFLFDEYLKPGGLFLMHDLVSLGVGLINSNEDCGYKNVPELTAFIHSPNAHIADQPVYQLSDNYMYGPVHLAIQTFLAFRPTYKFYKIMDSGGFGIILKTLNADI